MMLVTNAARTESTNVCTRERNIAEAVSSVGRLQTRDEQRLNKLLFPDMVSNGGATGKEACSR
jgi:hypothetical protein